MKDKHLEQALNLYNPFSLYAIYCIIYIYPFNLSSELCVPLLGQPNIVELFTLFLSHFVSL